MLGDKVKQKHEVGDVVIFYKKVSTVDTEVPLGARGVICDYCEGDVFPYYVTFNNVGKDEVFDEDELISVGHKSENADET